MGWQDIQAYNNQFAAKAEQIKAGPVQTRQCTDWGCLIIFALIFIATFGGGAYFIASGKDQIWIMLNTTSTTNSSSPAQFGYIMAKVAAPIAGMIVLSILLTKAFPKPLMYFLMGFTLLIEIALAIVGFATGSIALGITFAFIFLINVCMIYCLWDYFKLGLKLLECAARFITEKPAVYFVGFMCLILNALYIVFWIFSWLGVYSSSLTKNDETLRILTYVWYVDAIFWGFFLYYVMTFLVASACAYWYYQSNDNSVLRGINNIKYHLGSICFGAIVITIITILRMLASSARRAEGAAKIAACIAQCILKCIEDIVKALNCFSMIVMSVTGEGYIDSAKSAVCMIFQNLSLFIIVDYFSNFYNFFTTVFIGLVPAFIGGGIVYVTQQAAGNPYASTYAIYTGIIIFLLSVLVSSAIIGMLILALDCIMIFYFFDKKFASLGMPPKNIPKQIKQIFNQSSADPTAQEASIQYLNQRQQQ